MGMTDSMKEKMIKVVIDDKGNLEFRTPNGERLPAVIESSINWEYCNKGLIRLTIVFDAYMDNQK